MFKTSFPYTQENKERMVRLADHLIGTCKSLDDGIEAIFGEDVAIDDFDIELLHYLDDMIMLCDGCAWWVETSDLDEDQQCSECSYEER